MSSATLPQPTSQETLRTQGTRPIILVITITKGGYRKTTLTAELAVEWAMQGLRVLMVDADETNAALTDLFLSPDQADQVASNRNRSVVRLFTKPDLGLDNLIWDVDLDLNARDEFGARRYSEAIRDHIQARGWRPGVGCLHLVPGHEDLSELRDLLEVPQGFSGGASGVRLLAERALVETLRSAHYDVVLIDTAPAKGIPLKAAMQAADGAVVSLGFDRYGVGAYNRTLDKVLAAARMRQQYRDEPLAVQAVVAGRYDEGLQLHHLLLERYRQTVGTELVPTCIPEDGLVTQALQLGVPIQLFAPSGRASQAVRWAAAEVAKRTGVDRLIARVAQSH